MILQSKSFKILKDVHHERSLEIEKFLILFTTFDVL